MVRDVRLATPELAPDRVQRRPWGRATLWLAFLGPFFFATYGAANWLAARRESVASIVFEWEQQIPFAPWTIVPYWSIDLFYAISLFVCATKLELDVHAKRLLAAQLVCVAVFIAFPLRFTFERDQPDGLFGAMFDLLMGFDQPFNQMPSLHIALLVIIWLRFLRHAHGAWRWIVHGWGSLIALSVLTTYQHHFIDVPVGAWVGWLCVWLFPEETGGIRFEPRALADRARRRLAACYAVGAAAIALLAVALGGSGLWLFWISGSLALVALIYAFSDETAFQKRTDGSLTAASWWLLGPYFAGAWLNSRWWTRSMPGAHVIVPGLYLGRMPGRTERAAYAAIVDVTAELPCNSDGHCYLSVPQLDLTVATSQQIARAVDAIQDSFTTTRGPVLVCCALGFSRSAVAVAAWLLASGRAANIAEAVTRIRDSRRGVVLRDAHIAALERFAAGRVRKAA